MLAGLDICNLTESYQMFGSSFLIMFSSLMWFDLFIIIIIFCPKKYLPDNVLKLFVF